MNILKLFNYISYFEIEVKGRKPRLGHRVEFEFKGHHYKGQVVEVGRTVLLKNEVM